MVANIAADLGVPAHDVNVKAKTTEKLGFTGRDEGIAAARGGVDRAAAIAQGLTRMCCMAPADAAFVFRVVAG